MNILLKNYIQQCLTLKEEEITYFSELLTASEFPKKSFLLRAGEICNFEAFVLKGCVKSYLLDAQGTEVILTFATENWWVSDITSFHEQRPSRMFIETLEPTQVLLLSYQAKEQLLQKIPALERMFRLMVQRHLSSYQERLFDIIALPAENRYEHFLQKYPTLPLRVPQHLIAAYLGISPEFLSRLRNRQRSRK